MRISEQLPAIIENLCKVFLDGLQDVLGDNLYGVYLFGAVAFPETTSTKDIDFHVILAGLISEREHSGIKQMHDRLAEDYPPLGVGMDGYYLLLADAGETSRPMSQLAPNYIDDAWALHRAHIRAGRCIVLYGPDPRQIYPAATWAELERDLLEQMQFVEEHLVIYPAYCTLNLCRLMYSFEKWDVVISKAAAAEWALGRFAQWQDIIEAAQRDYGGCASAQDEELMMSEVKGLYRFADERIRAPGGS